MWKSTNRNQILSVFSPVQKDKQLKNSVTNFIEKQKYNFHDMTTDYRKQINWSIIHHRKRRTQNG